MESSIIASGVGVHAFTLGDYEGLAGALNGRDGLVIPELEKVADFYGALDGITRSAIVNFVENGGLMVVHGDTGGRWLTLLNSLFGYSLVKGGTGDTYIFEPAGAFPTPYLGGPATLPNNSACNTVVRSSLPVDAKVVYAVGDSVAAFYVPVGRGWIVFHAWDWYKAEPVSTVDGGWNEILRNALAFDPVRETDTDRDDLPDTADLDDDDDGVPDTTDEFPLDPAASVDTDGDGMPDNYNPGATALEIEMSSLIVDPDDDNDGVSDTIDNCRITANADQKDTDFDGIGDVCDPTDDRMTCFPIKSQEGKVSIICF